MRTTSLLNVGPPSTGGGTGCSTARCRAATSAKTKADAMMMRRMGVRRNIIRLPAGLLALSRAAAVHDLAVDDRRHALRIGKRVGRNAKDVLRQDSQVRQLA